MIYQTTSTQLNPTAGVNETKQTGPESGQGKDVFLKMFMTQMTNQNPLDPMDNTEFTAQLATFSSLEQLTKINTNLEALTRMEASVNTSTALSLVGKEVQFSGNLMPVAENHVGKLNYTLPANSSQTTVTITDQEGNIVRDYELGELEAGFRTLEWDGNDNQGNRVDPGVYKIAISAFNSRDEVIKIQDYNVSGLVTGYERGEDGTAYLLMGESALPLEKVMSVSQANIAANPSVGTDGGDASEEGSGGEAASSQSDSEEETDILDVLKQIASVGGMAAALL